MRFRNYRLQLLLRMVVLAASIYFFARLNFNLQYNGTLIGLGIFILLQVWLLILLQERTSKLFLRFLRGCFAFI